MEPYDDSAPFPPEWEGEQPQGVPPELLHILRAIMGGGDNIDKMVEECRREFRELLAKCALVANLGCCGFESSSNKKDTFEKGFHAMTRWNMDKQTIENAGLTVAEVEEVWKIHMTELNAFFESIKRQNIDKGFGTSGE